MAGMEIDRNGDIHDRLRQTLDLIQAMLSAEPRPLETLAWTRPTEVFAETVATQRQRFEGHFAGLARV